MKQAIYLLILLFTTLGIAQERLPGVFTYQGRALQPDGITPLSGSATFSVQVRSANGNCLLYQESHAGVDLTTSAGFFALNIGDGTASSGLAMTDSFSNLSIAKATLSGTCGGAYTPLNQDSRVLRITVDVGGGPIALDDQYVYTAPQALVADTLNGFKYNQFVQSLTTAQRDALTGVAGGTTIYNSQTGKFERYSGSWGNAFGLNSLAAGAKILAPMSATNDWLNLRALIGTGGITATENANDITLSVDTNTIQARVTGTCGAGNFITAVAANGTVTCSGAGTGTVTSVAAGDTAITVAGTAADPTVALTTCADDQILKMDGTAWNCEADAEGITSINVGATLTGNGIGTALNVAANAITHDGVNELLELLAPCSMGEILKYIDGVNGWECATETTVSVVTTNTVPVSNGTDYVNSPITVATTNVGIGVAVPGSALDINGAMTMRGMGVAPATSGAGNSRIYTDATGIIQVSQNDGAYAPLATAGSISAAVSGTTNYIPKFTSANAIGNSTIYETGGNVGIGTTAPTGKLDVEGGNIFLSAPASAPVDGDFAINQYSVWLDETNDEFEFKAKKANGTIISRTLAATAPSLTNFTESVNTAAPNATVPVVRLLATNAATNVDIALSPKGIGALTAQQADSTAAGGNKRNSYSVDWQTSRTNATQVASGVGSVISGGSENSATNPYATVPGGYQNSATGWVSFATGYATTADSFGQATFGRYNMPKGGENPAAWVTTDPLFVIGNGSGAGASRSTALMVLKNGNVGIGTATPNASALLDVTSTTKGFLAPRMTEAQRDAIATPTAGLQVYNTDDNKLNIYNGTIWQEVSSTIGAGIDGTGTANTIPKFTAASTVGNSSIVDDATDVTFANPIVMNNPQLYFRINSVDELFMHATDTDTAASANTFVGAYSANTSVTGGWNTALGFSNLSSLTSGTFNVGVGSFALLGVTTGGANVAVGYEALTSITTSSGSTGVGHQAGKATTSGTNNTSVGSNAGTQNTTGSNNVNIGYRSGSFSTTSSGRVAVGSDAMRYPTGQNNTAIGFESQIGVNGSSTGINNTSLGFNTLKAITSGNDNVATGWDALGDITTGSQNTALGSGSGATNTTGAGNIFIGYNAGANETGSNKLYIDNSNTATPLIHGDFSTNDLTINGGLTIATAGKYFNYQPNAVECADDGILKWNATDNRWICGTDSGGASIAGTDNRIPIFNGAGDNIENGSMEVENVAVGTVDFLGTNPQIKFADSLFLHKSGPENVFLGVGAGNTAVTGTRNVSVGKDAMLNVTTATDNTAIGHSTLKAVTTGLLNTAVGSTSLEKNISGQQNAALGTYTLLNNTTGSFNSAFGSTALQANTTASQNDAFGTAALYSNTTGTRNSAFGFSSLSTSTTGTDNVAIGNRALEDSTVSQMTAVGSQALMNNTTGLRNTAVGFEVLMTNTTAANNTAVGFQGLKANTTGFQNTSLGSGGLAANTTGSNNTALGSASMKDNTTGVNNTAVGTFALYLTNASNQVAVGYSALYNSTGAENTAVGSFSGGSVFNPAQAGARNTSLGFSTLVDINGGNDNVAIGWDALGDNTTGSQNTSLGSGSGATNTTGAGNVFIGYNAGANETGSNKLYIDNSNTATPLIHGDFSTGSLTINGAGGVTATAYYYTSDERLKQNIETLSSPLHKILSLRGVSFDWRENNKSEVGLIAQEVEEIYPDLVSTDPESGMKAVKYGNLVAPLIESTKELYGMCKMQEEQIAKIEAKIQSQDRRIASVETVNDDQGDKIDKLINVINQQQKQIDKLQQQVDKLSRGK